MTGPLLHEQLREYNRWRRGAEDIAQPDPKTLGILLDAVADRLELFDKQTDALREVSQTLAWSAFGECRGFSNRLLPPEIALNMARDALGII